jgi:hypothetical protein
MKPLNTLPKNDGKEVNVIDVFIKVTGRTVPRYKFLRCLFIFIYLFYGKININKHLEKLLRVMVLPITLIKCAQQEAEPQIKTRRIYVYAKVNVLSLIATAQTVFRY